MSKSSRPTPERLLQIKVESGCLVARPGSNLPNCHEHTFCDCAIDELFAEIDALTAELEKANADYRQARDAMYKVEDLRHQALAYAERLYQALRSLDIQVSTPQSREALALPKPGEGE